MKNCDITLSVTQLSPFAHSLPQINMYLYNNKCFARQVLDAGVRIWACDSSLEPSWPKNDGSMKIFRFARPARPQRAKMCFFTT